MTYLIVECRLAYAVALDEEGAFHRVPNLGYEVGQRVDDVVVFEEEAEVVPFEPGRARRTRGRLAAVVALAACLCAAVIGGAALWTIPVGTVRMSINPEVSMDVNRFDRVVGLVGENEDGVALVEGLAAYGRTVDEVSDELATRAEEQGYLAEGGTIELEVESDDDEWRTATEDRLIVEIEVHLEYRVVVNVHVRGDDAELEEPDDDLDEDLDDGEEGRDDDVEDDDDPDDDDQDDDEDDCDADDDWDDDDWDDDDDDDDWDD